MAPQQSFVAGGGEMGARIRELDWSQTPLGPIDEWPQSLRSALSILLPSKAQIALFWGPQFISLYNDAYRPVFGAKHPRVLGKPISEAWDELWRTGLKELFEGVVATGEAFWARDRPFFMERHGYLEETYFDVSYDPVRDESGNVGGIFCIVSETTGRVVGERRLRTLRDLAKAVQDIRTVDEVYTVAAAVLAESPQDIPVALLCAATPAAERRPVVAVGLEVGSASAAAILKTCAGRGWPRSGELFVADASSHGLSRSDLWPEPVRELAILPIGGTTTEAPLAHVVAAINPRRRIDDDYRDFL
jgi:PAS fold